MKNPPANEGDMRNAGSIPGSERSPGGGHGNPLQYSCLENPVDRRAWWATVHEVAKSQTRLKWLSMHVHFIQYKNLRILIWSPPMHVGFLCGVSPRDSLSFEWDSITSDFIRRLMTHDQILMQKTLTFYFQTLGVETGSNPRAFLHKLMRSSEIVVLQWF